MHKMQLERVAPETERPLLGFAGGPLQGVFELCWNDKRLRLLTVAHADASNQIVVSDPQHLGQALARLITQGRASAFSKNDVSEFIGIRSEHSLPAMVKVNAETFATFEEEAVHDKAVRECFRRAVRRIRAQSESIDKRTSESHSVESSYIEEVLECGCLGNLTKWYDEKLDGIRGCMEQRKDDDYFRENVPRCRAPMVWIERPPLTQASRIHP